MFTYARVEALPKTSSGKVQKRLLREYLREPAGKHPDKKIVARYIKESS
jgi:acyl-coenzyme A synthetase/AMP-(fatty) acid ligase